MLSNQLNFSLNLTNALLKILATAYRWSGFSFSRLVMAGYFISHTPG